MGPRQRVDAIDLHKSQGMQQPIEICALASSRFGAQQKVPVQKKTARGAIVQKRAKHLVRCILDADPEQLGLPTTA